MDSELSRFALYVVESPGQSELLQGVGDGGAIAKVAAAHDLPCNVTMAKNKQEFFAALGDPLFEVLGRHSDRRLILHLSAHGSKGGFLLTSREPIVWDELRLRLKPIHEQLPDGLILAVSTCSGASALRMSAQFDVDELPYRAAIGNTGSPTWENAATAFAALYDYLANGATLSKAVEMMNTATDDTRFRLLVGSEIRQIFLETVDSAEVDPFAERALSMVSVAATGNLPTSVSGTRPDPGRVD
jgi:hypothetical protein